MHGASRGGCVRLEIGHIASVRRCTKLRSAPVFSDQSSAIADYRRSVAIKDPHCRKITHPVFLPIIAKPSKTI